MPNIRILADNRWDQAALTATSEAMPVAYTQRSERPFVWRSAGAGEQQITATFPAASYINCVALARHNLGGLGLLRIELLLSGDVVYDTGEISTGQLIPAGVFRVGIDAWGATYNDRIPSGSDLGIYWLERPIATDQYRLTLTPGGGDYVEIGRIFAGQYWSPRRNIDWSPSVEWVEDAEHVQTQSGSIRTIDSDVVRRRFGIKLSWLDEADRQFLITQLLRVGQRADLLVSLYPESGGMREIEHTIVCRRDGNVSHTHNMSRNWQSSLKFVEI